MCTQVYLHEDALCLLSTVQYSAAAGCLSDNFMHATNHSVQAKAEGYRFEDCACTISELETQMLEESHPHADGAAASIFKQMQHITQGVFLSVEESRKCLFTLPRCFELFGLDFLVSDELIATVAALKVDLCNC